MPNKPAPTPAPTPAPATARLLALSPNRPGLWLGVGWALLAGGWVWVWVTDARRLGMPSALATRCMTSTGILVRCGAGGGAGGWWRWGERVMGSWRTNELPLPSPSLRNRGGER